MTASKTSKTFKIYVPWDGSGPTTDSGVCEATAASEIQGRSFRADEATALLVFLSDSTGSPWAAYADRGRDLGFEPDEAKQRDVYEIELFV
jgi:hypothetical protein